NASGLGGGDSAVAPGQALEGGLQLLLHIFDGHVSTKSSKLCNYPRKLRSTQSHSACVGFSGAHCVPLFGQLVWAEHPDPIQLMKHWKVRVIDGVSPVYITHHQKIGFAFPKQLLFPNKE